MKNSAKIFFAYAFLALFSLIVNFAIYNYSFNIQATPYLNEEQRVDSGLLMLKTTLPAYFASAILFAILFYLVAKFILTKGSSGRS